LNNTVEQGISDIVGCLTDPIIGADRYRCRSLCLSDDRFPDSTDRQRLDPNSLTQPIDSDWTQIYLYVATQTYKQWNKGEMPADIVVESISDYQMQKLNRLKAWLYERRIRVRVEKDRAERREKKEEAEARMEAEQPALFQF